MHVFNVKSRWLALCIAALLAGCDHVDEITPRHYLGLVVGHAAPLKMDIEKSLLAHPGQPVPQAGMLKLPTPSGVAPLSFDFGWVTATGTLIFQSKEYGVILVQEPRVEQGRVKWICVVSPPAAKPNLCGSDHQDGMLHKRQ